MKRIKETEKEILLQNIRSLPDKMDKGVGLGKEEEGYIDEDRNELINAANLAFSSPNPNFIVLDRELLENFQLVTDEEKANEVKLSELSTGVKSSTESDA